MFGTDSKEECTSPTGIDKYMYRIIGITEEGQLYLIKETFLKEDSTIGFVWNTACFTYTTNESVNHCLDGICPEWNEADLFRRINGTANGKTPGNGNGTHSDTDIFVDSTQYDYLKSGDNDGVNGSNLSSEWYNLIENHEWMYGDTITAYDNTLTYIGDIMYSIETGTKETQHYFGPYQSEIRETYRWPAKNKVTAKISLMYIHDYLYSYYDGFVSSTRGNPGTAENMQHSWINFQLDGYNKTYGYDWMSTRGGISGEDGVQKFRFAARAYGTDGAVREVYMCSAFGVRPVFYLSSRAKIIDGNGTKSDPYILSLTEDSF